MAVASHIRLSRMVFKTMLALPLPLTPSELRRILTTWPPGHGLYRGVVEPIPAAPFDTPSAPLRALRDTAISAVTQLNTNLFLETTIAASGSPIRNPSSPW